MRLQLINHLSQPGKCGNAGSNNTNKTVEKQDL
jgi:hypothetical protein